MWYTEKGRFRTHDVWPLHRGGGSGIGQPGVPAAAAWVVSMYDQKTLAVTIISPNVKEYKVLLHFKEGGHARGVRQ
jgi:hypothetical protein